MFPHVFPGCFLRYWSKNANYCQSNNSSRQKLFSKECLQISQEDTFWCDISSFRVWKIRSVRWPFQPPDPLWPTQWADPTTGLHQRWHALSHHPQSLSDSAAWSRIRVDIGPWMRRESPRVSVRRVAAPPLDAPSTTPPPTTEYDLENKKSEKFENEGDFGFEFWMSLRGMGETYGAIGPVVSHVEKRRAGNLFPRKTVPNESAGANVRQLVDFPWDVRIIFRSKRVAVGLCLVLHDGRQRHTVGRENAGVLMDEDLFYAQRPGHIAWKRWKKREKKRKTKHSYLICRNKRPGCLIFRSNRKTVQNQSKAIGFMYSPLWKITHQNPSVSCTPPFEKSPIKTHRFCILPPLKNHSWKAIGFMYSPL